MKLTPAMIQAWPRCDGFVVAPDGQVLHGHRGDCVHVYHFSLTAWKAVIWEKDLDHPIHRASLMREHMILKRMNHPHIVKIGDYEEMDGLSTFPMVYYPKHLSNAVVTMGEEERKEVVKICEEVIRYLYEHDVVHLDLGIKNWLWDPNKSVPILFDFQTAEVRAQPTPFRLSADYCGTETVPSCCGGFQSVNFLTLKEDIMGPFFKKTPTQKEETDEPEAS